MAFFAQLMAFTEKVDSAALKWSSGSVARSWLAATWRSAAAEILAVAGSSRAAAA